MLNTVQIGVFLKKKRRHNTHVLRLLFFKATTRFELVLRVLQTRALPLGYVAAYSILIAILL